MADRNFSNRTLYHGDNLDFLRGMNSETINLIATDPPFNKSRDFHATPDSLAKGAAFQDRWSWQDDIHDDWLDQLQQDETEVWHVITTAKEVWGDDMGAFLCWLGVRVLEMHRILADDGSLYVHCDATAGAYIKQLMDAVFGKNNFRNEIIWKRRYGTFSTVHQSTKFGVSTDTIFFYAKSDATPFSPQYSFEDPQYQEYVEKHFNHIDENGRRYQSDNLANPAPRPNLIYEYKGYKPPTNGWAISREKMEQWDKEGRLHFPNNPNGRIRRKRFVDELRGKPVQNLWDDIQVIASQSNERTGYPTQKPLALYERIIAASSNPGDMVLDPFCGCATTPVAAERLGRQWVGMDIWDGAHQIVLDRLEAEGLAVPGRSRGGQQTLTFGDITYTTTPPKRTDSGEMATLALRTPTGREGQRYPAPRTQHGRLLVDIGALCQGCGADYGFDPRVLEVDHINPRSQGGTDAYDNLTLLCPPCNKEKRDRLTLIGLQGENRKNGYMRNEANLRMGRATGRRTNRRRR